MKIALLVFLYMHLVLWNPPQHAIWKNQKIISHDVHMQKRLYHINLNESCSLIKVMLVVI